MSIKYYDGGNFEEMVKGDKVVVDFYADWCGPCKMLGPILEEIANDKGIDVVKVNVDEYTALAQKYQIRSIPAMFVFSNGELVNQAVGLMPKAKLEKFIFAK